MISYFHPCFKNKMNFIKYRRIQKGGLGGKLHKYLCNFPPNVQLKPPFRLEKGVGGWVFFRMQESCRKALLRQLCGSYNVSVILSSPSGLSGSKPFCRVS